MERKEDLNKEVKEEKAELCAKEEKKGLVAKLKGLHTATKVVLGVAGTVVVGGIVFVVKALVDALSGDDENEEVTENPVEEIVDAVVNEVSEE